MVADPKKDEKKPEVANKTEVKVDKPEPAKDQKKEEKKVE